ncbi:MAG: metallophosphoesterase [Peptoniphilus sp.]|nr:metallophosphoesterase [Peptoniphilus sp.]MDY3117992.1 metallophosphoesterase [Peptoniphilus sp.]
MRFLHTADLHLGRSFPYEKAEDREVGRKDRFLTFDRILKLAAQEQVDYLFLVGDIFEQEKVTNDEVDYVLACLRHGSFRTLLLLGNHDYKLYDYIRERLPENVILFSNEEMDLYADEQMGVIFYGTSWSRTSYNKILQFHGGDDDETCHRVLLHHGNWSGGDGYFPVDANLIHAFDYIALGHVHKPAMYENKLQMCGTPEPLDRTDRGKLGVVVGTIDEQLTTRYVPVARRLLRGKNYLRRDERDDEAILADAKEIDASDGSVYSFHISGTYSGVLDRELRHLFSERGLLYELIWERDLPRILARMEKEHADDLLGAFLARAKAYDADEQTRLALCDLGMRALLGEDYDS